MSMEEWGFVSDDRENYYHPDLAGKISLICKDSPAKSFLQEKMDDWARDKYADWFETLERFNYSEEGCCLKFVQWPDSLHPELCVKFMPRCGVHHTLTLKLELGGDHSYVDANCRGYTNSGSDVESAILGCAPWLLMDFMMTKKIDDMQEEIDVLKEQIADLRALVEYAPGGAGAMGAQAHFESLVGKN